jgi:hypothetical protein
MGSKFMRFFVAGLMARFASKILKKHKNGGTAGGR